jgi:asparagine synthase (glutamine-hydrolysing)
MGFGVPIDSWLRGPLRPWADELLSEEALQRHGLFNAKIIRERWHDHLSGGRNWQYSIWTVLMFQDWFLHNAVSAQAA